MKIALFFVLLLLPYFSRAQDCCSDILKRGIYDIRKGNEGSDFESFVSTLNTTSEIELEEKARDRSFNGKFAKENMRASGAYTSKDRFRKKLDSFFMNRLNKTESQRVWNNYFTKTVNASIIEAWKACMEANGKDAIARKYKLFFSDFGNDTVVNFLYSPNDEGDDPDINIQVEKENLELVGPKPVLGPDTLTWHQFSKAVQEVRLPKDSKTEGKLWVYIGKREPGKKELSSITARLVVTIPPKRELIEFETKEMTTESIQYEEANDPKLDWDQKGVYCYADPTLKVGPDGRSLVLQVESKVFQKGAEVYSISEASEIKVQVRDSSGKSLPPGRKIVRFRESETDELFNGRIGVYVDKEVPSGGLGLDNSKLTPTQREKIKSQMDRWTFVSDVTIKPAHKGMAVGGPSVLQLKIKSLKLDIE